MFLVAWIVTKDSVSGITARTVMAVEALIIGPVMVQPRFRENLHETLAGFMNAVQTDDGGLESVGLMGPSSVSVSDETRYDDAYDLPPAEKVAANPFVEVSSTSLTTESDANSSPTVSSTTQGLRRKCRSNSFAHHATH